MRVDNQIAFRIIKDINISPNDILTNPTINKVRMENILEDVRAKSFQQYPSRHQVIFVFPSEEYEKDWLSRLFSTSTGYYLLKLYLTGELIWFNADYLDIPMTTQNAHRYWGSEITSIDSADKEVLPEGLFIGEALVKEVIYKQYDI